MSDQEDAKEEKEEVKAKKGEPVKESDEKKGEKPALSPEWTLFSR